MLCYNLFNVCLYDTLCDTASSLRPIITAATNMKQCFRINYCIQVSSAYYPRLLHNFWNSKKIHVSLIRLLYLKAICKYF